MYGIIYCIKNKSNGKVYIGQTTQKLSSRIKTHLYDSRRPVRKSSIFCSALRTYGLDGFEVFELDKAENQEELNEKEIYYILKYKSTDRDHGYNLKEGGSNGKHTDEFKKKVGDSLRGRKWSEERLKAFVPHNKGKTTPAEVRANLREKNLGKKRSEESKKAQSESMKKYCKSRDPSKISRLFYDKNPASRKVKCLETREIFQTMKEAATKYGYPSSQGISKCCTGYRPSYKGLHWVYCTEETL